MVVETSLLLKALPLIGKVAAELVPPAKGMAVHTKEKLQVKFRKGFEQYIGKQITRFSTVKTIISSAAPIPLLSIYVNLHLATPAPELKAARDDDFLKDMAKLKNVLFTATAGAGKSMLMRYLYLRFLESQTDRLPVFIELRDLNQHPTTKLFDFVRDKISEYIAGFSDQQLKYAMDTGHVILFLDGFDEVDHDKRKDREREINELSLRFENLWTFVTSRPASDQDHFVSWEKFHVFRVQPFAKPQVELLISKITYDEEIKSSFKKKLSEGLFETHKEFLTNPLLTIMMLITLEQFADVPAKIHLFYEYAFEALFARHDVTKGGFQRKRHTTLPLDDFKRLFSYFCMISYMRKKLDFSPDTVLDTIQQSISSSQITTDKELFRNDLTESTCMLVRDGLEYAFSHRSFQEYFAAYFLARVKVDEFENAMPHLLERIGDNVLTMFAEMSREKFEEAWALPAIQKVCKAMEGIAPLDNPIGYCKKVLGTPILGFFTDGRGFFGLSEIGEVFKERAALVAVYDLNRRVGALTKKDDSPDPVRPEFREKIQAKTLLANDPRFEPLRATTVTPPRARLSHEEPEAGKTKEPVTITLTEADNGWFNDYVLLGPMFHAEAKVLRELKEEIDYRVQERRRGLAKIFAL